jgi:integrase
MDIEKVKQETKTPTFNKQSFEDYLDTFREHRTRTVQHYLFYWDKWTTYQELNQCQLGQQEIKNFLSKHKNNKVARAFISNLIDWIRESKFPELVERFKDFKLTEITGHKLGTQKKEFRTIEQIYTISKAMPDIRGQLMVLVGFFLGLRVSELCNITTKDINWQNWTLNIMEWAKGGKEREMLIYTTLRQPLYNYVEKYIGDKAFDTKQPPIKIFNISVRKFHKILYNASIKAIGEKTSPHTLRRSCATWLRFNKNLQIDDIKLYLDHNSITTTQGYIDSDRTQLNKKINNIDKTMGG